MKHLKRLCAASVLTLMLALSISAGEIPNPGQMETPLTGQMETPKADETQTDVSGQMETPRLAPATEMALDLLLSMLAVI